MVTNDTYIKLVKALLTHVPGFAMRDDETIALYYTLGGFEFNIHIKNKIGPKCLYTAIYKNNCTFRAIDNYIDLTEQDFLEIRSKALEYYRIIEENIVAELFRLEYELCTPMEQLLPQENE